MVINPSDNLKKITINYRGNKELFWLICGPNSTWVKNAWCGTSAIALPAACEAFPIATEKPVGFLFGSSFALFAENLSEPIIDFIPPLSWIKAE